MDDTSRIEEFENRVVDLVFAVGGTATIWRTHADHDPTRMLRGLIVEMAPGQDSMTLVIAPEGHIINLFEMEQVEKQALTEAPYCFVKTQFGTVQGHLTAGEASGRASVCRTEAVCGRPNLWS